MKFYSIARVETHGIEEFEWPGRRGCCSAVHVDENGTAHTERIGVQCFRSRKRAVGAGKGKILAIINIYDCRIHSLEARLRELA